ncbi:MAG TPA: hypothetical protein VJS39_08240 [Gemmatimonadaceae bacterium]|nr:hypothetical protein [Gemmatimonadaceae bacterium]
MPSRLRVWRAAAAAFIVINLGGGIYAAATGEAMHAAVHVVLLVLGIAAYSGLRPRRVEADNALPTETTERLKHLEQSVDALAIGVERVGEAQRYQTKILDEKTKAAPPAPPAPNTARKAES